MKEISEEKSKELEGFIRVMNIPIVDIDLNYATMLIERRPIYCDRGRYSVKAWHKLNNLEKCYIDEADQFPRYYFNFDCMVKEINSFINFRGLIINDISMKDLQK